MTREVPGPRTRFAVTRADGQTEELPMGPELFPVLSLQPGAPPTRVRVEAEMVFVGYGPVTGTTNMPDIAGRVVVVVNGAPRGASDEERTAQESEGEIGRRIRRLLPLRPAAIVVLVSGRSAAFVAQLSRRARGMADEASLAPADSLRTSPMIVLAALREGSPLVPEGWPTRTGATLAGRRFSGFVDRDFMGYNVVGVVRGRDSAMARSYVAYGAHYDHIGVQPPVHGDSIANGADDDGSGSVALLAIARAFATGARPRRSMLFVWHVGEEEGLLGSEHFTSHPTVPIDSIVAQLNVDMVGRNAPESLYVVGPAAAPHEQSRRLGAVLDSVNRRLPRPFAFNREWDSPTHPEQIYYRSDHYNYARRGVPIVFFTSGLHADYHRVSDEPSRIDYDKLAHVCALLYVVGDAVANSAVRPR
jgi:hypothetical protein